MSDPKVIVALDYDCAKKALDFVSEVSPKLCHLKVGKELFTACGPALVTELVKREFKVFLDLKFHDIPATVAKALKAAADLGVWMVNVHAMGSKAMLESAANALAPLNNRPYLIAVTVLTSMDREQLNYIGLNINPEEEVLRLAALAKECGLDGVVSSARETALITDKLGRDFLKVTPGIRPVGSALGDQKRVVTPVEAVKNGASYLVIGRPITGSENPVKTLTMINQSIDGI